MAVLNKINCIRSAIALAALTGIQVFLAPLFVSAADEGALLLTARCRSGEYRCGDGQGSSQEQAREAARVNLATSIQALVMTRQTTNLSENTAGLSTAYESESSVVSVLQLEGLTYHDFPVKDKVYRSLAMIAESSLQASMDKQRQRIRTLVSEAQQSAQAGHIDDALRLGYWAFLLCHTIDTLQVDWARIQISDPKQAIQEGLAEIVSGIELVADPAIDDDVLIGVPIRATYLGRPARFDMEIYTGAGMDYPHVERGRGYIELHWDPATWDQRRQTLSPRLLYAYEGKMRPYPDLLSLYQLYSEADMNTYLTLDVEFPFAKEPPKKTPEPPPVHTAAKEKPVLRTRPANAVPGRSKAALGPIGVLVGIKETNAFLQALGAFAKDGRLAYHKSEPSVDRRVFVAVANADEVLGLFQRRTDGFHEVNAERVLGDLKQFSGAYTIWITGRFDE